jgi:hypothetical protein
MAITDLLENRLDEAEIDWASEPWASARPALQWLRGERGLESGDRPGGGLEADDALEISRRMLLTLRGAEGELAWSSFVLQTALASIAFGVGGPPEPFLRALFEQCAGWELRRVVYELVRAVGLTALVGWRGDPRWDLSWYAEVQSDAQAAMVYCSAAVKAGSLTEAQLRAIEDRLEPYGFVL